jgi:hypothetical protein
MMEKNNKLMIDVCSKWGGEAWQGSGYMVNAWYMV